MLGPAQLQNDIRKRMPTRHALPPRMAESTQKTHPKKGAPIEIPVPKISTIRAAIRKVAKPK
jgi:hypothetical protein